MTSKKHEAAGAEPEKASITNTEHNEAQPADESFVMRGAVTTTGALADSATATPENLLDAAEAEEPKVAEGADPEEPRDELAFSIDPHTGAPIASGKALQEAHDKMNALDAKQRAKADKD